MPARASDADGYLTTIGRIEPDIHMIDTGAAAASISISLRRIADTLEAVVPRAVFKPAPAEPTQPVSHTAPAASDSENEPEPSAATGHTGDVTITADEAMLASDLANAVRRLPEIASIVTAYLIGCGWMREDLNDLLATVGRISRAREP